MITEPASVPTSPISMKAKLEEGFNNEDLDLTASLDSSKEDFMDNLDRVTQKMIRLHSKKKKSTKFKPNDLTELKIFGSGAPIKHRSRKKTYF